MTRSDVRWMRGFLAGVAAGVVIALSLSALVSGDGATVGPAWIREFGTPDLDQANGVAQDATGVYVAGFTRGDLAGANSGADDAFLRKYDANGTRLWSLQFGTGSDDVANAAAVGPPNVTVAGYTEGDLFATNNGSLDVFVETFDPDGAVLWADQFGTSSGDLAYAVTVDATGIYVGGHTEGSLNETNAGDNDAFVRKYALNGTHLWTHQFGTVSRERLYALAVRDTAVYAAGFTEGDLNGTAGDSDGFLRKYDADGAHLWTRQFGTEAYDVAYGVAADATGVYVVGETEGNLSGTNAGGTDGFLRKYDADGAHLWTRQFGTSGYELAFSISADATGVYLAGETEGDLAAANAGFNDAYVRKNDAGGNHEWTLQLGTASDDQAFGVATGPLGVYAVGDTGGELLGQDHQGDSDAFVVRVSETPAPPASVAATPGDGRVTVSWAPASPDGNLPVTSYRVYRGTPQGDLEIIAVLDSVIHSYVDRDVAIAETYRYAVSAVNGIGEGPPSPEVLATLRPPPDLVVTSPLDGTITNDPVVTVSGITDPDASVVIIGAPDSFFGTGNFSVTYTLPDGVHQLDIFATIPDGLSTHASVTVTVDTAAPPLSLTAPADGSTVQEPTILAAGATEAGARLVVNGLVVDVAPDGSFRFVVALQDGTNVITATATDAAGNTATRSVTVTFLNPASGLQANQAQAFLLALLGLIMGLAALGVVFYVYFLPKLFGKSREPPGPGR